MLEAMFDIGFGEMVLLAAIALIAIGPKQLPEVARAVGKLLGELKKTVGDVTSTVVNAREETDRVIRKVTEDLTNVTEDINRDVAHNMTSIQQSLDARPIEKSKAHEPSPIVPLPQHAGDPLWMVNPDIPRPEENAEDLRPSVIPATGAAPFAMAPAKAEPSTKSDEGEKA